MCGIFFSCNERFHCFPSQKHVENLQRRGPDSVSTVLRTIQSGNIALQASELTMPPTTQCLAFVSTVLSLRGESVICQPLEDPLSGSVLCWNGEAWKSSNCVVRGNDAKFVLNLFLNATRASSEDVSSRSLVGQQTMQNLMSVISGIAGPYAFVFYDAPGQRVVFGRDNLGRRSLLIKKSATQKLMLCSISEDVESEEWQEVECDGMYTLDLRASRGPSSGSVERLVHVPWVARSSEPVDRNHLVQKASTNSARAS